MTERRPGQQLARRRLGTALRRHREQANVRLEAAAAELECSPAKVSRLETGQGPAKLWEVRVLLDLYEVDDQEERVRLEQWARESKQPGWWEREAADLISALPFDDANLFLAAETEAARVRTYSTPVVQALLQTPEYAAAHVRGRHPEWSDEQVQRFVSLRLQRQEGLLRERDPLQIDTVVDESSLRRLVGGRETLLGQIRRLVDTLERLAHDEQDNIVLRVLPFSAGVPGRALSTFTIFDPRHPEIDLPMAYVEDALGGVWAEPHGLEELTTIFDELSAQALDPELSLRFLQDVMDEL